MKKIKKLNKKVIIAISTILILFIASWIYFYNEEKDNIKIDEYNFEQLDKVIEVLDKSPWDSYTIDDLTDFNKDFNQDIQPIKNCYYIRSRIYEWTKWTWWYIFWFKLESKQYIEKYWTEYYAYPKYDLPVNYYCGWSKWCKDDWNFDSFEYTISNPCQD